MSFNVRASNPEVRGMIVEMEKLSKKEKSSFWKNVAVLLNKPRVNKPQINLWKLDKHVKDGDVVIVPGKILGYGQFSKKVTVSAFRTSESAQKKLKEAGSKVLTLTELMNENPKGKGIKIIR
ncbi:MAG: 50S ribosomal protein L18e [Candidatus Diapherotrites archaeon]|nr:50S ribosomal protein L18e [Candidatus Diapherotrites archaeon]